MHTPRGIVFDLDGTLIDSREDIAAALNLAIVASGRAALPLETITRFVGDGARALCARAANLDETDPALDAMAADFLDRYTESPVVRTTWMAGAIEALDALADLPIALCTNKPRRTTDAVLDALGVRARFAAIVAGGDVPERKPAPGPVLAIAARLGLEAASLVVVGDGPQDVEAGRRAGARTVGVVGGFVPRERLAESAPDVLIESLAALPAIVDRWRGATTRLPVCRVDPSRQ